MAAPQLLLPHSHPRLLWLLWLLLWLPLLSSADLFVVRNGHELLLLKDLPAAFGKPLPEAGVTGKLVQAHPFTACHRTDPAPFSPNHSMVALIQRGGGCDFETKVRHAQEAGYHAAVVYNTDSNTLVPMGGDDDDLIPSVFIGHSDAVLLIRNFTYPVHSDFGVLIVPDEPFDINIYLMPFAIVVGICLLVMIGIILYKCLQDYRRTRRHRLPRSALRKIPVVKFKSGEMRWETCVICLDDFVDGDKVRVLPCEHGYHQKCIDPWLLKTKRICPQCRKKVFSRRNPLENNANQANDAADSSDSDTDERAPLIRQQGPRDSNRGGGTFQPRASNQELLVRAERQRRLQEYLQHQEMLDRRNQQRNRRRGRERRHATEPHEAVGGNDEDAPPVREAECPPPNLLLSGAGGSLPVSTFLTRVETHSVPQQTNSEDELQPLQEELQHVLEDPTEQPVAADPVVEPVEEVEISIESGEQHQRDDNEDPAV